MICCLCGETFEPGEALILISQYRFAINQVNGQEVLIPIPLEDGTDRKLAHPVCPGKYGAPLALVGADGGWSDV
jgi:hypothetical protein